MKLSYEIQKACLEIGMPIPCNRLIIFHKEFNLFKVYKDVGPWSF